MMDDFENWDSTTTAVQTGCGKLYITVVKHEGQILKVITHRKSNFECDLTFFDALNRQTSFQTNRELEQTINDLRGAEGQKEGHFCRKYGIQVRSAIKQGMLGAYSCADAVARVLEREIA